jgi:hypothetical protein
MHGSFTFEHLQALHIQVIQPFVKEEVGEVAGCDTLSSLTSLLSFVVKIRSQMGESRATIPNNPDKYPPL